MTETEPDAALGRLWAMRMRTGREIPEDLCEAITAATAAYLDGCAVTDGCEDMVDRIRVLMSDLGDIDGEGN